MVGDRIRVACVQLEARDVALAPSTLQEAVEAARTAGRAADVVVLPEATYPGYVLHDPAPFLDASWWERGLSAFADVARETRAYVAVGLIRTVADRIRNSAALLGPDGNLLGVTDKSFLWHFDSQWFAAGDPGVVVRVLDANVGVFVCADARMMEIPRRLTLHGARLLLDTTALVVGSSGANGQIEYMLEARAWENGAHLAMANKCGREAGIARYAGCSAVFGPDGERLAEAPPDEPAIIAADLDMLAASGPPVARARDGYPDLREDFERMPIARVLAGPPPSRPLRVAMVQRPTDETRVRRELVADLVVTRAAGDGEGILSLNQHGFRVASSSHASGDVVEVDGASIGFLAGDRLAVPEEVRRLMLKGASVVLWDRPPDDRTPAAVLRTRADENRVYVIAVGHGSWQVIAPSGAVAAESCDDGLDAGFVELHLGLTWAKEMAPTTDVVRGRRPQTYPEMV